MGSAPKINRTASQGVERPVDSGENRAPGTQGRCPVNREVARDRAANGGKLTPAEKAKVNRQDNKMSRHIDILSRDKKRPRSVMRTSLRKALA